MLRRKKKNFFYYEKKKKTNGVLADGVKKKDTIQPLQYCKFKYVILDLLR